MTNFMEFMSSKARQEGRSDIKAATVDIKGFRRHIKEDVASLKRRRWTAASVVN